MKKSWGLTQKILDGRKTIESRWYMTKRAPFDKIVIGDTVYFKDSGFPVSIRAEVSKVMQFSDLTPKKVRSILNEFGGQDGIGDKTEEFFELFKNRKYCMLIFLKNPEPVKPFEINKKGYGMMLVWICTDRIDDIRKK